VHGRRTFTVALVAAMAVLAGCGRSDSQPKTDLMIFHADSLLVPFEQIEEKFEAEHPEIDVIMESSGSNWAAHKVTELARPCDIIAVADYRIIDNMLIPGHASWSIRFATNQVVLGYSNSSRYASEITTDNWHEILLRPDVTYGHSDPEQDPCGYWTLIVWKLADFHYGKLADGRLISEALDEACPPGNVRADLNDLHPLLNSGVLDYVFMYRSVAQQQHLKYRELPPEINLGDPAHEQTYHRASVVVKGKQGTQVTRTGTPIVFAITILDDATHPAEAKKFLQYLLGPVGRKIMKDNGQELLQPLLAREGQPVPPAFADAVRYEPPIPTE